MRVAARLLGVLCTGLLLGAGAGTSGATLYVNRVVVAPPGSKHLYASTGRQTIGSPRTLNDVLMITGQPVRR